MWYISDSLGEKKTSVGTDAEKLNPCIHGGIIKWYKCYGKQMAVPQ
jgi:hypothetical protein